MEGNAYHTIINQCSNTFQTCELRAVSPMYVLTQSLQFATLLEQSPDFFSTLHLHYPLATIINQLGPFKTYEADLKPIHPWQSVSYSFLSIKLYQPILMLNKEAHKYVSLNALIQHSLDVFVKKFEPAFYHGENAVALSHNQLRRGKANDSRSMNNISHPHLPILISITGS